MKRMVNFDDCFVENASHVVNKINAVAAIKEWVAFVGGSISGIRNRFWYDFDRDLVRLYDRMIYVFEIYCSILIFNKIKYLFFN